jgi:hypothetical protein
MKCWYYLHESGDLIFKRWEYDPSGRDFSDSPFCLKYWAIDTDQRFHIWGLLCEALALGANHERVTGLAEKWGCNNLDAAVFASKVGIDLANGEFGYVAKWPQSMGELEPGEPKPTALEALSSLIGKGDLSGKFRGYVQ